MSKIIAGIYEIQNRIGAGGGGIVYLGRHLNLEKPVVLKADKRTLSAGMETLRREVDMLKGLSHTYIPQVYDFVQEDDMVYTVMDFIEGESLDKLLGRNQIPSQPQVIRWACQLLKALDYLHSRPPYGILHGDIKPANIMLKPDGDICLIDFNIALALGEEGAVKVGFSRGYASPEHYGADYISGHKAGAVGKISAGEKRGQPEGDIKTLLLDSREIAQSTEKTAGGTKAILLDARSDIYSLGATLYHLLSGRRPAQDAAEVEPLGPDICSAAVSGILQKAMEPDPEKRYQSAREMLADFLSIHKRDDRVIRHKRRAAVSAAVLVTGFLAGGFLSFVGLKQLEQRQEALALAEYSADRLETGDVKGAVELALQAVPEEGSIWEAGVTPQARKALADALGVYDLSDGFKASGTIELPSAPFKLAVSPDGARLAAVYAYEAAVFDMDSRKEKAVLPVQESALSDAVFTDRRHLIYAGRDGIASYDIDGGRVLWTGEAATTLAVSADYTRVAAVNRAEEHVTVYRTDNGEKTAERFFEGLHMQTAANDAFADPEDSILTLNGDGTLLAVSFHNGGLSVFDLEDPERDMIIYRESDYRHFEGGFYGKYFAYCASDNTGALFGLVDCTEGKSIGGYESRDRILLQADERGIYLAEGNLLVRLNPETMEEKELAYTEGLQITAFSAGNGYVLAATNDNGFSFYDDSAHLLSQEGGNENCDFTVMGEEYAALGNRNEPSLRVFKLEKHGEAQLLSYDVGYWHEESRISRDGQTVMLFSIQGFRVYDRKGGLVAEAKLPEADSIYDQQFIKSGEGSWLEVVWYDGTLRRYSAADGTLLAEERVEPPDRDLYEEFYTEEYRIASPLHGTPEVYRIDSGKRAAVLEEDSYLTYVTELGEYIITEYVSAAGERYGILLDRNLQKLAELPGLCDVAGDMLVFDYGTGNLRQCRLYSLQELVALGETYDAKEVK